HSVVSFIRYGAGGSDPLVIVCHFTPEVRSDYRIGVPGPGRYDEILNSDAAVYGGGNVGNLGGVSAEAIPQHGYDWSVALTLPPLAVLYLRYVPEAGGKAEEPRKRATRATRATKPATTAEPAAPKAEKAATRRRAGAGRKREDEATQGEVKSEVEG